MGEFKITKIRTLNATGFHGRMKDGESRPPELEATDQDTNERFRVIVKLKDPLTGKHYGPTSLVCELICSVIGRALGLQVPDHFIVNITNDFVASVPKKHRELFKANKGAAFGLLLMRGFSKWAGSASPTPALRGRLEDILAFDAAVVNADRRSTNSNLLTRGEDLFMIDHSLALFYGLPFGPEMTGEQRSLTAKDVQHHCSYPSLAGNKMRFERLLDSWSTNLKDAHFDEVRAMIPSSWDTPLGRVDNIFKFIRARGAQASTIAEAIRGTLG